MNFSNFNSWRQIFFWYFVPSLSLRLISRQSVVFTMVDLKSKFPFLYWPPILFVLSPISNSLVILTVYYFMILLSALNFCSIERTDFFLFENWKSIPLPFSMTEMKCVYLGRRTKSSKELLTWPFWWQVLLFELYIFGD